MLQRALFLAATAATAQCAVFKGEFFSGTSTTSVRGLAIDPVNPTVIVAVSDASDLILTQADTADATAEWLPPAGVPAVRAYGYVAEALGTDLYVAGGFDYDKTWNYYGRIMRRDAAGNWHKLYDASLGTGEAGVDQDIMAIKTCNGPAGTPVLYVGGYLEKAAGVLRTFHVAYWDPSSNTWHALGGGTSDAPNAITCGDVDGSIFVGGWITAADGNNVPVTNIAYWSGSAWYEVTDASSSTLDDGVMALSYDATNKALWMGGWFTTAGTTSLKHVTRFTMTQTPSASATANGKVLGTFNQVLDAATGNPGFTSTVLCFHTHDNYATVYIGGSIVKSSAGNTILNNVVKYTASTARYTPLTDSAGHRGVSDAVYSIVHLSSGPLAGGIVLGGIFDRFSGDTDAHNGVVVFTAAGEWVYPASVTAPSATGVGRAGLFEAAVKAIAEHAATGHLYIAGSDLYGVGAVSVNDFFMYDPATQTVTSPNAGVSDVRALAMDDATDLLYVGGNFATNQGCSGVLIYDINGDYSTCIEDGSRNALNTDGIVNALALHGGKLYVGGNMNWARLGSNPTVSAIGIFAWDLTTQQVITLSDSVYGNGIGGNVRAINFLMNGNLVVGGAFGTMAPKRASGLVLWDGTALTPVATAGGDFPLPYGGTVWSMKVINGVVHIGGEFLATATAGGSAAYITWDPVANTFAAGYTSGSSVGFDRPIFSINDLPSGGILFGLYSYKRNTAVGLSTSSTVLRISSGGTLDSAAGVGSRAQSTTGDMYASTVFSGSVLLAGDISSVRDPNGNIQTTIAAWDGSNLVVPAYLSGISFFNYAIINAMTVWNSKLVVAGNFRAAPGGVAAKYIATHSGTTGDPWQALTSTSNGKGLDALSSGGSVRVLYASGTKLYVGTTLGLAGGLAVSNVALYDSVTSAWSPLYDNGGTGAEGIGVVPNTFDRGVWAITSFGNDIYFGGTQFNRAGDLKFDNPTPIAKWNPSTQVWSAVGLGLSTGYSMVRCFAQVNSKLLIGGSMSWAGALSANNVAVYDGTNWNAVGPTTYTARTPNVKGTDGVSGPVNTIVADSASNDVTVGGAFVTSGSTPAHNIAKFSSGSGWAPVAVASGATGLDGEVHSILVDHATHSLLAAGAFKARQGGSGSPVTLNGLATITTGTNEWTGIAQCEQTEVGIAGIDGAAILTMTHTSDDAVWLGGTRFVSTSTVLAQNLGGIRSWAEMVHGAENPQAPCPSASATPSVTPSISPSASASPSVTPSSSPSTSVTASTSVSPSTSASPSNSPSTGASASASASASPTASTSPSALSAALSASPSASAAALGGGGGSSNSGSGSTDASGLNRGDTAGVVVGVLGGATLFFACCVIYRRKSAEKAEKQSKLDAAQKGAAGAKSSEFTITNPMAPAPTAIVVTAAAPDAAAPVAAAPAAVATESAPATSSATAPEAPAPVKRTGFKRVEAYAPSATA